MITECPISVGIFEGFSWIRCEGKGSFLNSPAVKAFGDARIGEDERCLVVDLCACTGMDSTFMGTLAGLAAKLTAVENGTLQIACPGDRNRKSLEDLGLGFLMEIDPQDAKWRPVLAAIREKLRPLSLKNGKLDQLEQAQHVLEAHQVLSDANESNARKFSNVVSLLKEDLTAHEEKP